VVASVSSLSRTKATRRLTLSTMRPACGEISCAYARSSRRSETLCRRDPIVLWDRRAEPLVAYRRGVQAADALQ
jgi:hypothetical protein